ncbi:hypothetical protein [Streptomyces sp. NPDC096142]|uniref:hypothetical protein n=1 Tax=Streptomyces sp. NPDC096142 TaxID=3366077 RepID=UPI00380E687B
MGIRDFARSLKPGNDAELARTQYAGRESATDRANRKDRERRSSRATRAARRGQAWDAKDRKQDGQGEFYKPAR